VLFQLIRIIYYRHNVLHYQFVFLLHCVVWSVARTIFWWFNATKVSLFLAYVLQSLSYMFLYSTFVCLALFFTMLVYKCRNTLTPLKRRLIIVVFVFLDVCYVVINSIFLFQMKRYINDKNQRDNIETNFMVFNGIMLLVLDFIIVGYGCYLSYIMGISKFKIPFFKQRIWILIFTVTIGILFFSRGLYNLFAISDFDYIDLEQKLSAKLQLIIIFLTVLWEIFPISMVIFLFWRIPKTNKSHLPPTPYTIQKGSDSQDSGSSLLFSNFERYDSEDESNTIFTPKLTYGTNLPGYSTRSNLQDSH